MTPEPVGSTHLRFDDARVIGKVCMQLPNVVRSPGRHEEFRNGPEVNIYIWEVLFWPPENVPGITGSVTGPPEGSGGPPAPEAYMGQ